MLWFDVGIKRYTTYLPAIDFLCQLWFDVGIKRYTTDSQWDSQASSCGLM